MPAMPVLGRSYLVLLNLLSLDTNSLVVLGQPVGELLVGRLLEHGLLPQVGGQVGVGGSHSSIGRLGKVSKGAGGTSGAGVAVLDTGHLQQLLGDGSRHDTSTAGAGISLTQTEPHFPVTLQGTV